MYVLLSNFNKIATKNNQHILYGVKLRLNIPSSIQWTQHNNQPTNDTNTVTG